MDQNKRSQIIFRILEGAFPREVATHSERANGIGPLSIVAEGTEATPEREYSEALHRELTSLNDSELVLRLEDMIEAQHVLNHPRFFISQGEYVYWAKLAIWDLDQATALFLGRRPDEIDIARISHHAHKCKFAARYLDLKRLMETWYWKPSLPNPSGPHEFLQWARKMDVEVPADLVAAVEQLYSSGPDHSGVDFEEQKSAISTRERGTFLKLILGMAVEQYNYDPSQTRSDVATNIGYDLNAAGLSLDPKTIRKILKEAADLHWEGERE